MRDEILVQGNEDAIISEMLKEYSDEDLIVLLGDCEHLLDTNEKNFKKLDVRGLKKLWYLISGVQKRCKRQILDNFQLMHVITLKIEKKIFTRLHDLNVKVADLELKLQEHKLYTKARINYLLREMNSQSRLTELMFWGKYCLQYYENDTEAKKILHIVSDIFNIDERNPAHEMPVLESAIKELGLSKVIIHPTDFADQILQDPECLPLYIRDGYDYNDKEVEISDYGKIIYKVYDLMDNQTVKELADVQNEDSNTIRMSLVEKSIEKSQIVRKLAIDICKQLLGDLRNLQSEFEQQLQEGGYFDSGNGSDDEPNDLPGDPEDQKRYSISVLTAPYLYEYSLSKGNYLTKPLDCSGTFHPKKKEMEAAIEEISFFSPAIIAKSNGIEEKDLYNSNIRNKDASIISFADLCFCLWCRKREQDSMLDRNAKYVVLVDYYDKYLRVSCYNLDNIGNISESKPWIDIKYNKLKKNIMEAIHSEFFPDISESRFDMDIAKNEIVLYRLFESDRYIADKFDALDISFIGRLWENLNDPDELRAAIDFLYDHKLLS